MVGINPFSVDSHDIENKANQVLLVSEYTVSLSLSLYNQIDQIRKSLYSPLSPLD